MKKFILTFFVCAIFSLSVLAAGGSGEGSSVRMPGLKAAAQLTQDTNGISHVRANNEADTFFLQGWVHARDRLFQMDYNRRLASGTLAELLGTGALDSDVQLRTIGLRRAAVRSRDALSPETRAALSAYARGVNAWIAAKPLPPEYGALELTGIDPWTEVDSVVIVKLIAFSLSFELDVAATQTYGAYVAALGPAAGNALFFEDLNRSAPFDPAATVPDASVAAGVAARVSSGASERSSAATAVRPEVLEAAKQYLDKVRNIPIFQRILDKNKRDGSNLWAVSASHSATGRPLIANDPHLPLETPSTFYPMGLQVSGKMEVFGSGFPGIPGIVQGYNRHISWGTTNNAIDVTDTYQEQLVPDPSSPSGLSTLYLGQPEPVISIPEIFRANQPGNGVSNDLVVIPPDGAIPAATLIVPRRNNGPIVATCGTGCALSVQYTGFSPTRELDAFLKINRATNLEEFVAALQFFDFGSQNFVYGDDRGNIAYFTTGEMPVREDLQAGTVNGAPPWFIRNGQGGNEWLTVQHPQPNQAVPYEVLPFSEMPQMINPPAGWFVNANNDPAGLTLDNDPLNQLRPDGGILYLTYAWDRGFRAGRTTARLKALLAGGNRKVSFKEMQSIQADVKLRDAEYFTPWITQALRRARAAQRGSALALLAADPGVREAVGRLAAWNFSTPTGIDEGWDAGKPAGQPPSRASIRSSVAATIYSMWRSRFIANTVDAVLGPLPQPGDEEVLTALRSVLDNFDTRGGLGASGVNFFDVPGVDDAADRRDIVILTSVKEALARLAGPDFSAAFHGSTQQEDYRWGRLHRVVFAHPLGDPFSIPPAGGAFPAPLPDLPGIPTDGGFETADSASHSARAANANDFMFSAGPVRRFVSKPRPGGARSESIWPGGTSGVLGSPFYFQFLTKWLANETIPLLLGQGEVRSNAVWVQNFVP